MIVNVIHNNVSLFSTVSTHHQHIQLSPLLAGPLLFLRMKKRKGSVNVLNLVTPVALLPCCVSGGAIIAQFPVITLTLSSLFAAMHYLHIIAQVLNISVTSSSYEKKTLFPPSYQKRCPLFPTCLFIHIAFKYLFRWGHFHV